MDQFNYRKMKENLENLITQGVMKDKTIYIFGHCNASEELINLLTEKGFFISSILDNNPEKQGTDYKGIPIIPPEEILKNDMSHMLICIVSRAYEAMVRQLNQIGYVGRVEKLVDYNTFAEYSLSQETISQKKKRVMQGMRILERIRKKYNHYFYIICPFAALGDVYYAMAYLPEYVKRNQIRDYMVITVGQACSNVAAMFGCANREILNQQDMDELVQAVLFTRAQDAFVAHHDRPYPNLLIKALYVKLIPFEILYRCGVFGLERDCSPSRPTVVDNFSGYGSMKKGRSVVLSPYAKSVAGIETQVWRLITAYYKQKGFQVYTNVVGEEEPLPGTIPLRISLMELQSAVEWAGTFIGIRSGLCDVIKEANCRKIVLFPDCYYSDTRWKAADFFHLDGWENVTNWSEAMPITETEKPMEAKDGKKGTDVIYTGEDMDL